MQCSKRLSICSEKLWRALQSPEKGSGLNVESHKSSLLEMGWLHANSQSIQSGSLTALFLWCLLFHGCWHPHSRSHQHLVFKTQVEICPSHPLVHQCWCHVGLGSASSSSCGEPHSIVQVFWPCWEKAGCHSWSLSIVGKGVQRHSPHFFCLLRVCSWRLLAQDTSVWSHLPWVGL